MTSQYYDRDTIISDFNVEEILSPDFQSFTLSNQGVFTPSLILANTHDYSLVKKENDYTVRLDRLLLYLYSVGFLHQWSFPSPIQSGQFDYEKFIYNTYPPNHPYDDAVVLLNDKEFIIRGNNSLSVWEIIVIPFGASTIATGQSAPFQGPGVALYQNVAGNYVPIYTYTRMSWATTTNISIDYIFQARFFVVVGTGDSRYKIRGTISGAPNTGEGVVDESFGPVYIQTYCLFQRSLS